jgi:hypothetical protein
VTVLRNDTPRVLLALLRLVGGAAFFAPALAARTLGLPADAHSNYLVRLFAARNVALAAGLLVSTGDARRLWWQVGIACDALDAGAGLLGLREGKERPSALVDTGASLVAAGLGLAGAKADCS